MTNETKHTPGKWHVDEKADDWGFIRDANGTLIASTRILDDEETIKKHRSPSTLGCPPQTLANARLLAAAPELLEALEENVRLYCQTYMHCALDNRCIPNDSLDRMPNVCKIMAKNKQLIASVKGEKV